MGSYNSQYQSYYSSLSKNKRYNSGSRGTSSAKGQNPFDKSVLLKRIFRELVGVFCLIIVVLTCKLIKTPETTSIYNYCKSMVSYDYDYIAAFNSLKTVNLQEASSTIEDYIEKAKANITGEKTIQERISSEFIVPVQGKIVSPYGTRIDPASNKSAFHYGVDIDAQEGTEVKNCADGIVKFVGEDKELGKYIIIDHGIGVETKYAQLKEIKVENGESVDSGDIIALSGKTGEAAVPHLHFELLYMGENKNPEEYLRLTYIQ